MADRSVSSRRATDQRRGEVLRAAYELFALRGFAATRLEDIAERAGVAKGTVVLHFPTKEALFAAVVESQVLPSVTEAERIAAAEGPALPRIAAFARWLHRELRETPLAGVIKLMIAEAGNFPELTRSVHERLSLRARHALAAVFAQGMAGGELRACDPHLAARLLVEPILMRAIWRLSFAHIDPVDDDAWIDTHLAIFHDGIVRRPT